MSELETMREKGAALFRYLRDEAIEPKTLWEISVKTGIERGRIPDVIVWLRTKGVDLRSTLFLNEGVYWLASREDSDQLKRILPTVDTLSAQMTKAVIKVGKAKKPKVEKRRTPTLTKAVRAEALVTFRAGRFVLGETVIELASRHGLNEEQVRDALWPGRPPVEKADA